MRTMFARISGAKRDLVCSYMPVLAVAAVQGIVLSAAFYPGLSSPTDT